MTIDEYVRAVREHLALPSASVRIALEDLREALTELASEVGEVGACAEFGDPEAYARRVEEEFSTSEEADATSWACRTGCDPGSAGGATSSTR